MLCLGIPDLVHYLDNFLFWAPDYLTCSLMLETAARLSARLGLPVEPSKAVGPTTSLTFLSIEVDTVSRELRLPRLKLAKLKDTVEHWASRRSTTKHQLEVLFGQLNDAAQVVPTGRPFLRNLLDAKSSLSKPHHSTRLNEGCRADLAWWSSFIVFWNGVGHLLWAQPELQTPQVPGAEGPKRTAPPIGSRSLGLTYGNILTLPSGSSFPPWWPLQFGVTAGKAPNLVSTQATRPLSWY